MYIHFYTITTIVVAVAGQGQGKRQAKYEHVIGNLGYCRATLIARNWMITTASCFTKKMYGKFGLITIRNTMNRQDKIEYIDVIQHPEYEWFKGTVPINDIALIHLARPINTTKLLKLPETTTYPNKADMIYDYQVPLSKIQMDNLSIQKCIAHFGTLERWYLNYYVDTLEKQLVCSKSANKSPGPCMDIHGSPLIQNNHLYGLASTFYDYGATEENCHRLYIFSNIASYVGWIKSVMISNSRKYFRHQITNNRHTNYFKEYTGARPANRGILFHLILV